jgi:hypothetical protein
MHPVLGHPEGIRTPRKGADQQIHQQTGPFLGVCKCDKEDS